MNWWIGWWRMLVVNYLLVPDWFTKLQNHGWSFDEQAEGAAAEGGSWVDLIHLWRFQVTSAAIPWSGEGRVKVSGAVPKKKPPEYRGTLGLLRGQRGVAAPRGLPKAPAPVKPTSAALKPSSKNSWPCCRAGRRLKWAGLVSLKCIIYHLSKKESLLIS